MTRPVVLVAMLVLLLVGACSSSGSDDWLGVPSTDDATPADDVESANDSVVENDATATTATTTTTPADDEDDEDGNNRYRLKASLSIADEDATLEIGWAGTFTVLDGVVSGSGEGSALSESSCGYGEDATTRYPYSLTATWAIEITGGADDEIIYLLATPDDPSLVAGGDTDASELCVEIAGDMLVSLVSSNLGDASPDSEASLTVPLSGGTTTFGQAPFAVEVVVTQLD